MLSRPRGRVKLNILYCSMGVHVFFSRRNEWRVVLFFINNRLKLIFNSILCAMSITVEGKNNIAGFPKFRVHF